MGNSTRSFFTKQHPVVQMGTTIWLRDLPSVTGFGLEVALDQHWGNHRTGPTCPWQFVREYASNPSWVCQGPSLGLFKLEPKEKDLFLLGSENGKMWSCRLLVALFPTSRTAVWENEVNAERGKQRAEARRQPWEYLSLGSLRPEITLTFLRFVLWVNKYSFLD